MNNDPLKRFLRDVISPFQDMDEKWWKYANYRHYCYRYHENAFP